KPVEPKPVEADVPSEAQVADWRAAPPPLRSSSDDAVSRPVMTATPTPSSVEEKTAEAAAGQPATPPPSEEAYTQQKSRRARRLMVGIGVAVVLVLGAAGGIAWMVLSESEERLWNTAEKAFEEGNFTTAADRYRAHRERFPESGRKAEADQMA